MIHQTYTFNKDLIDHVPKELLEKKGYDTTLSLCIRKFIDKGYIVQNAEINNQLSSMDYIFTAEGAYAGKKQAKRIGYRGEVDESIEITLRPNRQIQHINTIAEQASTTGSSRGIAEGLYEHNRHYDSARFEWVSGNAVSISNNQEAHITPGTATRMDMGELTPVPTARALSDRTLREAIERQRIQALRANTPRMDTADWSTGVLRDRYNELDRVSGRELEGTILEEDPDDLPF